MNSIYFFCIKKRKDGVQVYGIFVSNISDSLGPFTGKEEPQEGALVRAAQGARYKTTHR